MALREVAARHDVPLVVLPERRLGRKARFKRLCGFPPAPTPLEAEAARLGLPTATYSSAATDGLRRSIRESRTDLTVVASFPAILPPALLEVPGINLHQSLLPRHRGIDPLFWTFHANERVSGVTIHWLDASADSGDIISQQTMPVERGISLLQLYGDLGHLGAVQLADAIDAISSEIASRTPQDPAQVLHDPSPLEGTWRIESDEWPAERTWHFLRGVGDMYGHLCRDAAGQPLPMGTARQYRTTNHGRTAGTHEDTADGIRLYCRDGIVEVSRPTRGPSARR